MSIFSSIGKAWKAAEKKVIQVFRKEKKEQIEKEARTLKPELKAAVDDEIRKHGLQGGSSEVNIKPERGEIEIDTKQEHLAEQAVKAWTTTGTRVKQDVIDDARLLAETLADESGGNLEWIKNKLGGQNISLIGEDWFNDLMSKTKAKFSSKQIPQFTDKDWEKAKGYIWSIVSDWFQSHNLASQVYERAKQIVIEQRDMSLLNRGDVELAYNNLYRGSGTSDSGYNQALEQMAHNIIRDIEADLDNHVNQRVKSILNRHKK
jgi:hypothetical protein